MTKIVGSTAKATQGAGSNDAASATQADQLNVVEMAGWAVELPANLQAPAMELPHPELEHTVLTA